MKKVCFIVLILLSTLLLNSCFMFSNGTNDLESFFEDWKAEGVAEVGFYNYYDGMLYLDNEEFCLEELDGLRLAICVEKNGTLYGVARWQKNPKPDPGYNFLAQIYSFDIESKELKLLYKDSFEPEDSSKYYETLKVGTYCYYYDRCIVLYDGCKAVYFNIDDLTAKTVNAEDYVPYEPKYRVESVIKPGKDYPEKDPYDFEYDYKKVMITKGNERIPFSIEDMADRNEYVQKLLELPPVPTWHLIGGEVLQNFFYGLGVYRVNNVHNYAYHNDPVRRYNGYVFDDVIYFSCLVFDDDTDSNILIFSYDPEQDTVKYLFRCFAIHLCDEQIFPRVK